MTSSPPPDPEKKTSTRSPTHSPTLEKDSKSNRHRFLKFTAWFAQDGKRKFVDIKFWIDAEEFDISIEGDENVYRLKGVKTKSGNVASCWDLHLGATFTFLGRRTTLMQCDLDTRLWLEANVKRLIELRRKLEEHLSHYERVVFSENPTKDLGKQNLRSLMKQISELRKRLVNHRPTLAEQYRIA